LTALPGLLLLPSDKKSSALPDHPNPAAETLGSMISS
jgi:hypothetical protein